MLTLVPNISFQHLKAIFASRTVSAKELASPWMSAGDRGEVLTRSMWSIFLIAVWRMKHSGKSRLNVAVPTYFCESTLAPLRALGVDFFFYNASELETLSIAEVRGIFTTAPDIVICAHYFGNLSSAIPVLKMFCHDVGSWLIEDCAHVLLPAGEAGQFGDFVLYSPHKLLPTPGGAVLIVRKSGPNKVALLEIFDSSDCTEWAQQVTKKINALGITTQNASTQEYLWLLKRFVQRVGFFRLSRSNTDFDSDPQVSKKLQNPELKTLGRRSLRHLTTQRSRRSFGDWVLGLPGCTSMLTREQTARQVNNSAWIQVVNDLSNGRMRSFTSPDPQVTPYLACFEGNRTDAKSLYDACVSHGIPALTWPDLPTEATDLAKQLRLTRVFLPVHSSISAREILKKSKKLLQERNTCVQLVPCDERDDWERRYKTISNSNLLSAWEYGEAKSRSEGFVVDRFIARRGSNDLALLQILQKKYLGVLKVYRLARSPVFFDGASMGDREDVYRSIPKILCRFAIVSVAPNVEMASSDWTPWHRIRRIGNSTWTSSYLNIEPSEEIISRRLNGKWRNQLRNSEKKEIVVSLNDCGCHDRLGIKYSEFCREKKFRGISSDLLKQVMIEFSQTNNCLILEARIDQTYLGAIAVLIHGNSATYFVGVSEEAGRKSNVTNLLLWKAIVELKKRQVLTFDLGGIDYETTPTIAAFKTGLSGREYRLIGEYLFINI